MLRIDSDWSENVDLYQTIQEKSQYYTTVSASVNTVVLYEHDKVTSLGIISDIKSHKADATWASLTSMFGTVNFTNCKTLYIISDSPTSQYRNKKMIFLTKHWAVNSRIDVFWIFTESGHGKGPMDDVRTVIKSVVKALLPLTLKV